MKKMLCWLLAFLLTGCIALLGIFWAFRRAMDPFLKPDGTPASPAVIEEELNLIRKRTEEMADTYGFQAEHVMRAVTPEVLEKMNQQAASWWHLLLAEGTVAGEPELDTAQLSAILSEEEVIAREADTDLAEAKTAEIASAIQRTVVRTVLPLRCNLLTLALMEVTKHVDVTEVIRFIRGVPMLALSLCALLAGILFLLEKRRSGLLKHYGAALGAGSLIFVFFVLLMALAPLSRMIGEASPSLRMQYDAVASGVIIRTAAFALLSAAGCVCCLRHVARERKGG